ncbi:lantibiotic dehydratase [Streptomyces sp. NPDC088789]|uniref:lantibiotic dehydratase n=1 Tax=Streptomyces sp. NPDC088789 TaxID=3365899 RepID=UPI003823F468
MSSRHRPRFRSHRGALVRSLLHHGVPVPTAPDLTTQTPAAVVSWRQWVAEVWSIPQVVAAVRHASPDLAREADDLVQRPADPATVRRLVLSLLSYVQRFRHRVTPFGLFAGVAEVGFGDATCVRWGQDHWVYARADGTWLAEVMETLEADPGVRRRLRVMASNVLRVRGERLVLPWQPRALDATGTGLHEVSVRRTPAVEAAVAMTATALPYQEVVAKLAAAHRELGRRGAEELVDLLVSQRMLLTSLRPSGTDVDALGCVVRALDGAGATGTLSRALGEIHAQLQALGSRPLGAPDTDGRLSAVTARMREVADRPSPVAVDVRLDADMVLPRSVSWEAAAAAGVLARVSPEPRGSQAWVRYRATFRDRYGEGTLVPLLDLLDPATGLGLPADFHGMPRAPEPDTLRRDGLLTALAQRAVAEERDLVLDDDLIDRLAGPSAPGAQDTPAHLELGFSVRAPTTRDLDAGEFVLAVRRVSRGWGHFSGGRCAALLAWQDTPSTLLGQLAGRPASVDGAVSAQLSFPPLRASATHITRTPPLGMPLISLAEYREDEQNLMPADLAVTCHQDRLHLVSVSRGQVLEPATPHALQIECQTPTVARFLDEMQRGQSSRIIGGIANLAAWDWGAARHLAVWPRVRAGRSILSPATWRLAHAGLPGPGVSTAAWDDAFAALRARWRLPKHVYLNIWDTPLRLDLDHPAHRTLLRSQMERPRELGQLTLIEAEPEGSYGWCGGRPHEIITHLSSTARRRTPPPLTGAPTVARGHARLPGVSPYLSARLHMQPQVRRELLIDHLPRLARELPNAIWWLTPHDEDDQPHTLLTLRLPDTSHAPRAIALFGQWAGPLAEAGVTGDVALVPYRPHTGLWGTGRALTAAESVWAADTTVIAHQHAYSPTLPPRPVLAAANLVALAAGLHQDAAAGMRWLSAQPKPRATDRLPKDLVDQARAVASPDTGWAGLRRTPAGRALLDGPWSERQTALAAHRTVLDQHRNGVDTVLPSLIAAHLRLLGETADGTAWRLARTVALATTRPRTTGPAAVPN